MIRTLAGYIREFKKDSILTPVFICLEVVCEVIIPLLLATIIDNGFGNEDMGYVAKMGVCMLVVAMASLFCGAMAARYGARASAGFARNLRQGIFQKIQDFSFSNIDKFSTAGLVTRLTTDVTNIQNAYMMILRMFVRAPIMMISALVMTIYINARLSLIFVGAMAFLVIVLYLILTRAFPAFRKVFENYDNLNAGVQENLTAIRAVKAFVREDYEIEKFHKATSSLKKQFINAEKLVVLNMPVMQFTTYTCILLLSWLGAKSIVADTLTTGELMSLFNYTMQILMSLMMVAMVFVMVSMAKTSADRIAEVLNEESDLTNPEDPVMEVKDGSIIFDHVSFAYQKSKDNNTLSDINLEIQSGETVGILGGTGSGKTSLVQLIPRLYDVKEGSVKVGGIDVRDYDIETLRNQVAMVLQKNVLFSGTIKENLKWGNENASEEEMIRACQHAQAHEFISSFPDGYETRIEQGGTNVSGGQKQRLCIARALLKKPKILILDDSTSAVDTRTDSLIQKAFKEEIPDTTKLIIAQRISSIENADKIIVLDDGKINGIGTHEELLRTNDIYREVYESQKKGGEDDGK
ncbi:MAG: ABC transporter ATP-binding protein/permease [Lachnospiraceae bacterium]|nr:ABC transporter ATP-binding protein/permease [Lachnospiraceae bacterium]